MSSLEQERLLLGLDHNLDFLKHDMHLTTKEFIEYNIYHNLLPVITKPTRVTRNSATLIDNVIIGKSLQDDYDPSIIISDISDHFPSLVRMYKPSLFIKKPLRMETRVLNDDTVEMIRNQISETNWQQLLQNKNTNEAYNIYHERIQTIMNEISPIQTITLDQRKY